MLIDRKSRYRAPILNRKIDVYTKQRVKNKIGKYEHRYEFYKTVFAHIRLVRKRTREAEADTEYAILSHEIIVRANSLPEIDETYRFVYKNLKLQAKYIDYDFERDGTMFISCEQVVE